MNETVTHPRPAVPALEDLASTDLERMLEAGEEILECYRVLAKCDANIVGEVLRGQGTFYELDHYPEGDVFDAETHSQYYYHAHRGAAGEHGHFHTFLRGGGMPDGVAPVPYEGEEEWPAGEDALSHLVAVSMDTYGFPIALFATNRWVTAEAWYRAEDVVRMADRFLIDHACPSWPVNRWLSAMFRLYRPEIEALLVQRDEVVRAWGEQRPGVDTFEDRDLEITGILPVAVSDRIANLRSLLEVR